MKFRLVEDWKRCHKWISINCMAIAASFQGAWLYIPDDLRHSIPQKLITFITISLLILGIVGRLINQKTDSNVGNS